MSVIWNGFYYVGNFDDFILSNSFWNCFYNLSKSGICFAFNVRNPLYVFDLLSTSNLFLFWLFIYSCFYILFGNLEFSNVFAALSNILCFLSYSLSLNLSFRISLVHCQGISFTSPVLNVKFLF